MFSAVTSAFIIEVDPQLQPDSGDETAALLRVLIYKMDNTAFGNDVPALPEWNGPPAGWSKSKPFSSQTLPLPSLLPSSQSSESSG